MKLIKVSDLKGGEVLGRAVITSEYQVLLSEETVIRPDIIRKLQDLGIESIYIIDQDQAHAEQVILLKSEVEESFKEKVKDILDRQSFSNNAELAELSQTADEIITNILDEDEVVDRVYDIKERSADIYEHSINLCTVATLTALKLKMSNTQVHDIGVGCLIHDMGLKYLKIPYEDQDIETLSNAEKIEYMKHPVYGYQAIKDEIWLTNIAKSIVLYHHESLDGGGYPLHATEIPFEVQVVSVCDIFDEMICGIACKRLKVHEAVEYLRSLKGIKYYPQIVDALLEFTAVYPVGSMVKLSDGSSGQVIRQNKEFPDRPVVMPKKDAKGNIIPHAKEIDLIKINNIFIEKELS